ncbi:TPA: zinc ABC transporter substrate-binding protein [Streptococcus suis]|nr:zinc ABC transporter substrate-binding protein [Streptococcus suis]
MKKKLFSFLCLALTCLLAACQLQPMPEEKEGLTIVTSFYPIYSMVKSVSGQHNQVRMIGSRSGIHSYEPSAGDVRAIYDADVFIYHSGVLESWAKRLDPNLQGSSVEVLEASTKLELMRVPGLEEVEVAEGQDPASLYDPHTWLDPLLVADEAREIAKLLGEQDPDHAQEYHENAEAFAKEAEQLYQTYKPIFEKVSSKTFVTQHTAFSYLAHRFGLTQLGIAGVSEEEPSPKRLAEIKEFVEDYQVRTIFVEKGVSDKMAQTLAKETGVELKVLDPLEADPENAASYLDNLKVVLDTLSKELK